MIKTACPLDCYDACGIVYDSHTQKISADGEHPMYNGALCSILNKHIFEAKRIEKPTIDGLEVSLDEALNAVANAMSEDNPLLWRGSGHLGVMQDVTNLLIEERDGTLTHGSLCDGAGQAGIREGRGINRQLPPEQISKAEVIVVWGRNLSVTNSHIMPNIKGKKIIVIDPICTPIAQKADMHIQIRPRSDMLLALMLARFVIMQSGEAKEWLDEHGSDYDEFYDFTQSFRIRDSLQKIDIEGSELSQIVEELVGKRVVFLLGVGVQKYSIGHYAFWAIDSLASVLGLFGREGCGVSFLGESRVGYEDPFACDVPRVSIVNTPFENYNCVLVQGGNPAESMPNSDKVVKSLKKVKNLIYFGLYENETSKLAKIKIPAKNFLEKEDIRLSYGHHYISAMNVATDSDIGISEYDFTKALFDRLGLNGLKSEAEYLDIWKSQSSKAGEYEVLPDYQEIPYRDGFGKDGDEEFVFMDDMDDYFDKPYSTLEDEYWLLSPKSHNSLNTQFKRDNKIHISSSANYKDGDKVLVKSIYGQSEFIIKIDDRLRSDCISIPSGAFCLNILTPDIISEEGGGACYQEVKVKLSLINGE